MPSFLPWSILFPLDSTASLSSFPMNFDSPLKSLLDFQRVCDVMMISHEWAFVVLLVSYMWLQNKLSNCWLLCLVWKLSSMFFLSMLDLHKFFVFFLDNTRQILVSLWLFLLLKLSDLFIHFHIMVYQLVEYLLNDNKYTIKSGWKD